MDDATLEGDHTFSVQLGLPSAGTRNNFLGTTTVTIEDNEGIFAVPNYSVN